MESVKPQILEGERDKPWWMGSTSGIFTVKSAFEMMRHKKGKEWRINMWSKGVPFKISFFLRRVWNKYCL